jgi:hypothetical protein
MIERKEALPLMGSGNSSLCARSQETKVDERLKPAKQGDSSDELLAFVI